MSSRLHDFGPPPFRPRDADGPRPSRADIGASLGSADPAVAVFVAEDAASGRPLGFAHIKTFSDYFTAEPHGHVSDLVVAADAEGRGVGSALLEAAADWSRAKRASAPDAERLRREPAGEGTLRPAGLPARHAPHGQGAGGSKRPLHDAVDAAGPDRAGMTALAGGVLAAGKAATAGAPGSPSTSWATASSSRPPRTPSSWRVCRRTASTPTSTRAAARSRRWRSSSRRCSARRRRSSCPRARSRTTWRFVSSPGRGGA